MGEFFGGFNPGGEPNAVSVTCQLQTGDGVIDVFFAFDRADDHAIPAVVGGDFGIKAFKRQLRTDVLPLLSTF